MGPGAMKAVVCFGLLGLLAIAQTAGADLRPWSDGGLPEGDHPAAWLGERSGEVASEAEQEQAVWPQGAPDADDGSEAGESSWQQLWGWDHWLAQGEAPRGWAAPLPFCLLPRQS